MGQMTATGRVDEDEWLPLDTVRDTFAALVTGPRPLSLDGREFEGLPDRMVPLDELRDMLLHPSCSLRLADVVWRRLIERSRAHGGAWTVACAGMALPMLAVKARWFADRYRGERVDAHGAVLAGFVQALATVDVERPRLVARLQWATVRAGLAAVAESLDAPAPVPPGTAMPAPQPPAGHPDLVLAEAVANGVITRRDAELISATRLDGQRLVGWAREHGVGAKAAYSRRQRAEQRLTAYLRERLLDADPQDPTAAATLASRVRKNGSDSGLLGCGDISPRSASSEVPRCA